MEDEDVMADVDAERRGVIFAIVGMLHGRIVRHSRKVRALAIQEDEDAAVMRLAARIAEVEEIAETLLELTQDRDALERLWRGEYGWEDEGGE